MQSCFGILTITTISLLSLLVTIAGEFRVTNVTISNHVNVIVNATLGYYASTTQIISLFNRVVNKC